MSEYPEEWDLDELDKQIQQVYPTSITREQLDSCAHRDMVVELLTTDALDQYEAKEASIGAETLRDIERQVMLSMIDQHWREHLYEMDYLHEGINLRAMGQQDPLAEWQREGFDMFEAMMGQIEDNFVAYVFHLQVVVDDAPRQPAAKALQYSAPDESVTGAAAMRATAASMAAETGSATSTSRSTGPSTPSSTPGIRRSSSSRCGSRRRRAATSRASAGVARSTSCATVADPSAAELPPHR